MHRRIVLVTAFALAHALASMGASAVAEPKAKSDPQVRYFDLSSSIFSELTSEAILKEVRKGSALVSAELEVCHFTSATSNQLDRFVVPLKVEGTRLIGTAESQQEKQPVSVNLIRRSLAKGSFNFEGTVRSGSNTEKVQSTDNNDMSEQEIRDQFPLDTAIEEAPRDFSAAWPQALLVRVGRAGLSGVLEAVRGQKARIVFDSVTPSCRVLRSGHHVVQIDVEPESLGPVLALLKAVPGVTAAGFAANPPNMQRAIRFPSEGWRDAAGKLDRDKLAATISAAMAKAMSATVSSMTWENVLGDLTIEMKRPEESVAGLKLSQLITVTAIVASESLSSNQRSIVWIETVTGRIVEERPAPRLEFSIAQLDENDENQSNEPAGTDDLAEAVATALKGVTWDADTEQWSK